MAKSYTELSNELQAVMDEVKRKAYAEGFEAGREFDSREESRRKEVSELLKARTEFLAEQGRDSFEERAERGRQMIEKTREQSKEDKQRMRDEIVDRAKADVEELTFNMALKFPQIDGNLTYQNRILKPDFVVNKEKRTIVALARGMHTEKIREKGIAKCAPNDCFNVHIGKAIALRRALGLDVPSEYLNAPQPTEVRVGDVVKCDNSQNVFPTARGKSAKVVRTDESSDGIFLNAHNPGRDDNLTWVYIDTVKIIDDSREGVGAE